MIKSRTVTIEKVYETEDSFGEYQTYEKTTWYLLGIPFWVKRFNFQDHSIMEYFSKRIL